MVVGRSRRGKKEIHQEGRVHTEEARTILKAAMTGEDGGYTGLTVEVADIRWLRNQPFWLLPDEAPAAAKPSHVAEAT
jgi:hypothetical protein